MLKNISCVRAVKTQEENILGIRIDPGNRAPSPESSININTDGDQYGSQDLYRGDNRSEVK